MRWRRALPSTILKQRDAPERDANIEERGKAMSSRTNLENAASKALDLYESAVSGDLPAHLRSDEALYGSTRDGLIALARTLISEGAASKTQNGFKMHHGVLANVSDAFLEDVADKTAAILSSIASDKVGFSLVEAGHSALMSRAVAASDAVRETGRDVPNIAVAEAVHENEIGETAATIEASVRESIIPDAKLYDVTQTSLDLLETLHVHGADYSQDPLRVELGRKIAVLETALVKANYMLPGSSTARTTPYREQQPRGSRHENEAILAAATDLVGFALDRNALDEIRLTAQDGPFVRAGLSSQIHALNGSVALAFPELVETTTIMETSSDPFALSVDSASALHRLFDAAIAISGDGPGSASIDTQIDVDNPESEMRVVFHANHLKGIQGAIAALDETNAEGELNDALGGLVRIPGISIESAETILTAIGQIKEIEESARIPPKGVADPAKRAHNRSIPAPLLDSYLSSENALLGNGVLGALAAIAGDAENTASNLMEGRDAIAFATPQEAVRPSRPPNPENSVRGYAKMTPEMSYAVYRNLPPNLRVAENNRDVEDKKHVFVLRPGEGFFKDYDGKHVADARGIHWGKIRLRQFIRSSLLVENEKGETKPNVQFRAFLTGLQRKTIVAETEYFARILREESDRVAGELGKETAAQRKDYLAKADQKNAHFAAKDVGLFLAVLENSGNEGFATLKKHGDGVVIEHPEAPTVTAKLDRMGVLERVADGKILYKIDPAELRNAYEKGQPVIRMTIADDRPSEIAGISKATADAEIKAAKAKEDKAAQR